MRSFPSARAVGSAGTAGLLGVLLLATLSLGPAQPGSTPSGAGLVPVGHHDRGSSLKHRQHQVRGQLSAAAGDLDDASAAFTRATHQAAAARVRLGRARTHADDVHHRLGQARERALRLRDRLDQATQRLDAADAALDAAKHAVNGQRDEVRANVINTYTGGDPGLLAYGSVMSDSSSLQDLADNLYLTQRVVDRNGEVFTDLRDVRHGVAQRQDDVEAARSSVASTTRTANHQLDVVRGLYQSARTAKQHVVDMVRRNVAAKQRALRIRAHDRAVLRALRGRESRIKQQILALAAKEKGGYTGDSGGFLTNPAQGYPITSPFGYRIHPIYGYYSLHNGIDYGVPCGTPLVAAADGTVITEYTDAVYGNRLYLNVGRVNGHNITVVYNHLTGYRASVGEHVRRGEVVAISGTTGWSTGCHLHFTVLQDGVAVNPVTYL